MVNGSVPLVDRVFKSVGGWIGPRDFAVEPKAIGVSVADIIHRDFVETIGCLFHFSKLRPRIAGFQLDRFTTRRPNTKRSLIVLEVVPEPAVHNLCQKIKWIGSLEKRIASLSAVIVDRLPQWAE